MSRSDGLMKQFMSDDMGNASSLRLYCLISLLTAISLTWYGVLVNKDVYSFVLLYLVATFAPKVVQKFAEQKDLIKADPSKKKAPVVDTK